jgi:hypothetical protein
MKYIVFREFSLRYGFLTDWEVRGYVLQTLGAWNPVTAETREEGAHV